MKYLIWSFEHKAWWRPGEWGYTTDITQAGRFTFASASVIVTNANAYLPEGARNEAAIDEELAEALWDAALGWCPDHGL